MAAYGIPTVETRVATSENEAVAVAVAIGFPVVLNLHSFTVTHKTDVGCVQLDLNSTDAVSTAYRNIESAVNRYAGPGHFQGVSVQPMVTRRITGIIRAEYEAMKAICQKLGFRLAYRVHEHLIEAVSFPSDMPTTAYPISQNSQAADESKND
jgi:hypothetical protein